MESELMFIHQTFKYKGYTIDIRCEKELGDVSTVKAYHHVYNEGGSEMVLANITPYDASQLTVKMWIDAGMPKRQWVDGVSAPFTRDSLEILLKEKNKDVDL